MEVLPLFFMSKLECVMQCKPGALMETLDLHMYLPARKTNDGTKKWYRCVECNGIFCLDKMTRRWEFSAETYTELVQKGLLNDYLEEVE